MASALYFWSLLPWVMSWVAHKKNGLQIPCSQKLPSRNFSIIFLRLLWFRCTNTKFSLHFKYSDQKGLMILQANIKSGRMLFINDCIIKV